MSVESFDDLLDFIEIDQHNNNREEKICTVNNPTEDNITSDKLIINYEISYNLVLYLINNEINKLIFTSCIFNFDLNINEDFAYETYNEDDIPDDYVRHDCFGDLSFEFNSCKFKEKINFENFDYNGKVKFRHCYFNIIKINNATFKDLFEMSFSEIQSIVVFNKVDFNANCVFTKTKFLKNCIFIYSTFEKQGIFSRAIFKDKNERPTALDLSQCIVNGQLTFFETQIENYTAVTVNTEDETKFDQLTESGEHIPIQNKRETFRIIKNQLTEQNNLIEAEKYAKLEKQTYLKELSSDFKRKHLSNLASLSLNWFSNNHKTDSIQAFLVTICIAFVSHLILQFSGAYNFTFENYAKLLNPTDFSFYNGEKYDNKKVISGNLYIAYFTSKLVIGYGIYQFIQAFRKFK